MGEPRCGGGGKRSGDPITSFNDWSLAGLCGEAGGGGGQTLSSTRSLPPLASSTTEPLGGQLRPPGLVPMTELSWAPSHPATLSRTELRQEMQ